MGTLQGMDLSLTTFGAVMVDSWKEREFGWVKYKGGIWVSQKWWQK